MLAVPALRCVTRNVDVRDLTDGSSGPDCRWRMRTGIVVRVPLTAGAGSRLGRLRRGMANHIRHVRRFLPCR
ncbi:hypothetical protein D3C72_2195160 [compost metagenome]